MIQSVLDSLIPLIVNDSPYSDRVVALLDQPTGTEVKAVEDARRLLGNRLFVLDQPSLEAYLPGRLYERAGRSKDDDLAEIQRLKGDIVKLGQLKRSISEQIAAVLTLADLDDIPMVRDAVQRALNP
jgi:hypothetical protein